MSVVALIGMSGLSLYSSGTNQTLQWLIPTLATIILTYIFNYVEKNKKEKTIQLEVHESITKDKINKKKKD